MRNPLFDSDSPTPVIAFLSVTSKVAASATRIFDITFYYFSSNEWHLLEILAILSMRLGNHCHYSNKDETTYCIFVHRSSDMSLLESLLETQNGYAMINMMFYISMNLGTFACIVSFGLRTGRSHSRLWMITKDPFLALFSPMSLVSYPYLEVSSSTCRFFRKTLFLGVDGRQTYLYFLVSIGLFTSVLSIYTMISLFYYYSKKKRIKFE